MYFFLYSMRFSLFSPLTHVSTECMLPNLYWPCVWDPGGGGEIPANSSQNLNMTSHVAPRKKQKKLYTKLSVTSSQVCCRASFCSSSMPCPEPAVLVPVVEFAKVGCSLIRNDCCITLALAQRSACDSALLSTPK